MHHQKLYVTLETQVDNNLIKNRAEFNYVINKSMSLSFAGICFYNSGSEVGGVKPKVSPIGKSSSEFDVFALSRFAYASRDARDVCDVRDVRATRATRQINMDASGRTGGIWTQNLLLVALVI